MALLMPMVAALNIHASLDRLNTFLGSGGKLKPSEHDLKMYQMVKDSMKE